jgi:MFS family permease
MQLEAQGSVSASARRLLVLLTALNVLNFLDRQLLAGLAPLLMDELRLTHTEIGLLLGFAFVAFFSVAGLLLATIADRFSRPRLLAVGLALWSAMTAATGAAQGFGHVAFARLLVGAGEAILIPTALSVLADVFPPARLGMAAAVFAAGTPVGQALGYVAVGVLAPAVGWRGCFAVLGGLGLLGVTVVLAADDPPRSGRRTDAPLTVGGIARDLQRTILSVPAMGLTILGFAALAFAAGAALHTVTWLVHERGFTAARAALLSGLMVATAGPLGSLAAGALADRWVRRTPGGRALTLAMLAVSGAASSAVFYVASASSPLFHAAWFLSSASLIGWLGVALAAYEGLVPPIIRATAVAFAVLCLNLLGTGPGALVAGWLGDVRSLTAGLLFSAAVALLGAVPFVLAASRYEADSRRARSLA